MEDHIMEEEKVPLEQQINEFNLLQPNGNLHNH